MRRLRTIRGCDAGAVAVEFALVLPVLALLIAGLLDLGNAVNLSTKLDAAARAGAQFAMSYGYDTQGITNAVSLATAEGSNVTMAPGSPSAYCTCGSSTATHLSKCDGTVTCPGNAAIRNYVSITVNDSTPTRPFGTYMSFAVNASSASGTAVIQVPSLLAPP